jgi:hypothetical protein
MVVSTTIGIYISGAGRDAHSLWATGLDLAMEFFTGHYAASNNKNLVLEMQTSAVWM